MGDPVRPIVALEISALAERFHTGIANVTKALAREMLGDAGVDARFFIQRQTVPRPIVERLVTLDGGDILWWLAGRLRADIDFGAALDRPVVALYCAPKQHRRLFPVEVQIVHDLTTIVTPAFHDAGSVVLWQTHFLADLLSSDLLVAVSESTRIDIRTYCPQVANIPCIVVPLASIIKPVVADTTQAPYVVVLGTLEPRKNIAGLLKCLAENPQLLEQMVFVLVGRRGWGASAQALIGQLGLADAFARGRLQVAGFVTDPVRDRLLAGARCLVYPSLYEGFGLPVLEALAAGVPVITGFSSSLPEVGGPVALYCDTQSPASLAVALRQALGHDMQSVAAGAARRAWARQFSWARTYEQIRDAALGLAQPQPDWADQRA